MTEAEAREMIQTKLEREFARMFAGGKPDTRHQIEATALHVLRQMENELGVAPLPPWEIVQDGPDRVTISIPRRWLEGISVYECPFCRFDPDAGDMEFCDTHAPPQAVIAVTIEVAE